MPKDSSEKANATALMPPELAAGIARVEALLRVALRRQLANATPESWSKGRRRKILQFCCAPRTQQEIRTHIGSIAGYEIREYLDDGVGRGVLARYAIDTEERFEAVLLPREPQKRRAAEGTRRRRKGK